MPGSFASNKRVGRTSTAAGADPPLSDDLLDFTSRPFPGCYNRANHMQTGSFRVFMSMR